MTLLSERLLKLNKRLKEEDYYNPKPWYFENVNILDISENAQLKSEPVVIRKAYAIRYVAEHISTPIFEDELIVGVPNQNSVEFGISIPKYLTDEERSYFERLGISEVSMYGHNPPDFSIVITKGIKGLKKEIDESLIRYLSSNVLDKCKVDELRAMSLSLEALETLSLRYADAVLAKISECTEPKRKSELFKIYENCKRVPLKPARNLWEAIQSFYTTYTLLASCGEYIPLGRLDMYFKDFYELMLKKGEKDSAVEILGSLLIKLNERNVLDSKLMTSHRKMGGLAYGISYSTYKQIKKARDITVCEYKYNEDEPPDSENNKFFGQETNNRMMTCVVGGVDEYGDDATNPLSYLLVELIYKLKLLTPTMGVRINKNTPEDFIKLIAKVLRYGQGEPVIYNDEAIIKNYEHLELPIGEVRGYSSDGCWETVLPGKGWFAYGNVWALQCLEYTMNRGVRVKTGAQESYDSGSLENFESYEDFYSAFIKHLYVQMENVRAYFIENYGITGLVAPDPLLSVIMDDCIEKGTDFYDRGGAKYQFRMLLLVGFADTVDSLAVIKKLVFEEKKLSLSELNEALLKNFDGYERLLALIKNRVEKYGNDTDYADDIGVRLLKDFSAKLKEFHGYEDRLIWTGGVGTFHVYAAWGNNTAASANGRLAYDALAPNYSPVAGEDRNGPIAAILSSNKADLTELMSGTPVDIAINENEFVGEDGIKRLEDLIKGFCESDGQILTITSQNIDELRDAKIHPENHRNLRVRMGGLSAYFVQLAPTAQDKIIERFVRAR